MTLARCLLCAFAVAACAQGAPGSGTSGTEVAAADTLRGMVEVVGAEPATSIALLLDGGARAVILEGDRALLTRLQGLEVMVRGEEARPGVFRVAAATVRTHAGVPAVDGILAREGSDFVLVTQDGDRIPIRRPPPDLGNHLGRRVWIAGPPGRGVDSYGVIQR